MGGQLDIRPHNLKIGGTCPPILPRIDAPVNESPTGGTMEPGFKDAISDLNRDLKPVFH